MSAVAAAGLLAASPNPVLRGAGDNPAQGQPPGSSFSAHLKDALGGAAGNKLDPKDARGGLESATSGGGSGPLTGSGSDAVGRDGAAPDTASASGMPVVVVDAPTAGLSGLPGVSGAAVAWYGAVPVAGAAVPATATSTFATPGAATSASGVVGPVPAAGVPGPGSETTAGASASTASYGGAPALESPLAALKTAAESAVLVPNRVAVPAPPVPATATSTLATPGAATLASDVMAPVPAAGVPGPGSETTAGAAASYGGAPALESPLAASKTAAESAVLVPNRLAVPAPRTPGTLVSGDPGQAAAAATLAVGVAPAAAGAAAAGSTPRSGAGVALQNAAEETGNPLDGRQQAGLPAMSGTGLPTALSPPVASAVPAAPATHQPAQQPLAEQLSRPIFQLATGQSGTRVMTVQVVPDSLGPVTVSARLGADGVRIELFAATDAGRDGLRLILTELRRDLASQGVSSSLNLSSSLNHGAGTEGQGQSLGQGGSPRGADPGPRAAGAAQQREHPSTAVREALKTPLTTTSLDITV